MTKLSDMQRLIAANAQPIKMTQPNKMRLDEVQADADTWCYDCNNLEHSLEHAKSELDSYIQWKFKNCNTEHMFLHLTTGSKGGRTEMATVKPYQEQRNTDPELSVRVKALREHIVQTYKEGNIVAVNWGRIEADDGMAIYQNEAIKINVVSAIMSIDKDLDMIEGYHIDSKTFEVTWYDKVGKTYWTKTDSGKDKFKGTGRLWFWHQMLFGDRVDNIVGLPYLTGDLANRYVPTKKFNPKRKELSCGEKRGIAVLEGVTCDKEAFKRVREAYNAYYGNEGDNMMFEQAFLLWIRRTDNELDVIDYWAELGFDYQLNEEQEQALEAYKNKGQ